MYPLGYIICKLISQPPLELLSGFIAHKSYPRRTVVLSQYRMMSLALHSLALQP